MWGWLVLALGLLWLVGGVFGYFEGHLRALLLVFCGYVLVRSGRNLIRG
jgi:hypothetical protein